MSKIERQVPIARNKFLSLETKFSHHLTQDLFLAWQNWGWVAPEMVASDRLTHEQIHFFRLIHYSIPLGKRRQQKDVRSPEDCELQHHSMTCSNTISVPQIPYRALEDKYIVEN